MRLLSLLLAACCLCGCGGSGDSGKTGAIEDLALRDVTMPNGQVIRAEAMIKPVDLQRGMMFRTALPPGRGMLFLHKTASPYEYWMYQVQVPLDIIFMDAQHRILGVSANTPVCTTRASDCPKFGGYPGTLYVLEIGAGEARKYGAEPGRTISF